MYKNFTALIGIVSLLVACRYHKTPKELIDTFYKNQSDLNFIIKQLQTDKHLDSLFSFASTTGLPKIENSYPTIYFKLKALGIKHASSHPYTSFRRRWYYFETEWPNKYLICLMYNAYDSTLSKKDYYDKSEVSNETWGLGNNWRMFRLVKYERY